jgi:hypothetical protein
LQRLGSALPYYLYYSTLFEPLVMGVKKFHWVKLSVVVSLPLYTLREAKGFILGRVRQATIKALWQNLWVGLGIFGEIRG